MVIGFDASRAFVSERTGTENYSYQLLKALLAIDRKNLYRIYVNPHNLSSRPSPDFRRDAWRDLLHHSLMREIPRQARNDNFEVKPIAWPRLWTQGGLAWECLMNPPDILFIPAHTLPVLRWPWLKTVVTIHDLGAEYLPQYHQTPQKYYLNWSTIYSVKHATRIIAVSESTRRDLCTKLACDDKKIAVIHEGVEPVTK